MTAKTWFKLYRSIEGGQPEAVPTAEAPVKVLNPGQDKVKWTGLYKADLNNKTYTYTVKEVKSDGSDGAPDGYAKKEEGLTVTNTYKCGNWTPKATKKLTGRTLKDDEFTFELKEGDKVLQTVKNKADGTIPFADMDYSEEDIGNHTYTITEKKGSLVGITYDDMTVTFNVKVEDKGDGTLVVNSDTQPADTEFNNAFSTKVTFSKVALGQGTELAGAKIIVKKADGTTVDSWTSTGTALVLMFLLTVFKKKICR